MCALADNSASDEFGNSRTIRRVKLSQEREEREGRSCCYTAEGERRERNIIGLWRGGQTPWTSNSVKPAVERGEKESRQWTQRERERGGQNRVRERERATNERRG